MLAANGPLPVERAVEYILQACEALAEAHVAGIVHRDLKPDNLFVATGSAGKSVLKILDFGISKLSSKRTTSGDLAVLTQADDKFGTPVYMSPEQLRSSGSVDARADVWAIGVVLYELLTGRLPFDGDDLPELCTAILTMPPVPLLSVRPDLPVGMKTVLERCLEKECDQRYQNVGELAQELQPFASAAARGRIDHVVRVVREGGENVRPPTPLPGASSARAIQEAATLPASDGRLLTTGSGAASWGGVGRSAKKSGWLRGPVLIPAAATAAAIVVMTFFGIRGTPSTSKASPPTQAAATAAPPVVDPLPAAPASPSTVLAPPVETEPMSPPSTASPARAPGRPGAGKHGPLRAAASGSAKKPAPAPSSFDSTAVINPFE